MPVDESGRLAASATLLVNWRLDFNLNGTPLNDRVDEFEFLLSDAAEPLRSINVLPLDKEAMRRVAPESFRGWRISDQQSGVDRTGYYLDPQGAGYRYISHNHDWTRFDFFVTDRHQCEQFSSANHSINSGCGAGLDAFVDNEAVDDTVVWYSVSRHFTPHAEDYPAISATELSMAIVPFDWSARSTFSPAVEIPETRPAPVQ